MITYPQLQLKNHFQLRALQGSPWIFSNEITNFAQIKKLPKGSIVEVRTAKNQFFALAYFNPHSLISARIISYNFNEIFDESFFVKKITQAKIMREKFFPKPFYRLIHSEGDFLPGLVIDRFDNVFVCQISTAGIANLSEFIIKALINIFGQEISVIYKNDFELRKMEDLELSVEVVYGILPEHFTIYENDLKFNGDILEGQKTGWFFDQRLNRDFVSEISKDCNVLDAFCYLGGFGLNAIKGGAKKVVFVDSSQKAIEYVKSNCELLKTTTNLEFYNDKVYDYLEINANIIDKFNLIILDPPAFIKSKKDYFSGLKGYEKLIKLALPLLDNNALLMINSCSYHLTQSDLINCVKNACFKNNKKSRLIRCSGAGFDHPVNPALKENEYLKSLTFFID